MDVQPRQAGGRVGPVAGLHFDGQLAEQGGGGHHAQRYGIGETGDAGEAPRRRFHRHFVALGDAPGGGVLRVQLHPFLALDAVALAFDDAHFPFLLQQHPARHEP